MLHDGTTGSECVKRYEGMATVQAFEVPHHARNSPAQRGRGLRSFPGPDGGLLVELTGDTVSDHTVRITIPVNLKREASIAERMVGTVEEVDQIGHLVPITHPNYNGNPWEMNGHKVSVTAAMQTTSLRPMRCCATANKP